MSKECGLREIFIDLKLYFKTELKRFYSKKKGGTRKERSEAAQNSKWVVGGGANVCNFGLSLSTFILEIAIFHEVQME